MADILYTFEGKPYLNLTNKCPCRCSFCIRNGADGVGTAESLWLDKDPSLDEVKAAIDAFDFSACDEIVFCGYGEPLCALDTLLETARYLKAQHPGLRLRLNTNGLGDLINGKKTAPLLAGLIDTVSVSLNAKDAAQYQALCKPKFGEKAYDAMLSFAKECRQYVPEVKFSVVDVIPPADIAACKQVAADAGIPLRVRAFTE